MVRYRKIRFCKSNLGAMPGLLFLFQRLQLYARRGSLVNRAAIFLYILIAFMFFFERTLFAGPITIFNGTAEPLKKGKWVIESHYGYYQTAVIKNTAYWGYTQGNGHMDDIGDHDMRYINQALTSEVYYAFTDRLLAGILVPYVMRDVRKQPFVVGKESKSHGFGDITTRACFNIFDPAKLF